MNSKSRFVHATVMKWLPFFDLDVNQINRFNPLDVVCNKAQEHKVFSCWVFFFFFLKSK